MAAPIALSVSVALASIIAYGLHDFLTNFEDNGCEMTYMYEYPEYVKIDIGEEAKNNFPGYGLHIYGEGVYAKRISKLNLNGIPVLFIPGNSGSHKQVRSLGSVAYRMSEKKQANIHFNYFVVDINEELAGLYGGVLQRQTEFVHLCIKKIMTFYHTNKQRPTSVVLVGHSMGGMVARGLFTLADFDPTLVSTIITQATPHKKPVVSVDEHLYSYYEKVNKYWQSDEGQAALRHVTVVSTGGGYRDIQVRNALTQLDWIVAPDRSVSASTMSVPKSWVSTDHRCAVWCRQMVLLTQRALFDIVDVKTKQISTDPNLRMRVFQHHFLTNNALPDYLTRSNNTEIKLDPKVKWEIKAERSWLVTANQVTSAQYIAVPFVVEELSDSILVKSNLTNPEWLCYCDIPKGKTSCDTCTSLSAASRLLPPLYSNMKYARISFQDLQFTNDTHLVIIVPARHKKVYLSSDRYNSDERHLVYHLPNGWDSVVSYPIAAMDGAAMLKISNGSTFYSLHLGGLSLPITAYKALVTPQWCRRHSAENNEGSVLRLNVPWSNEETYSFSRYGKPASLMIKLQTPRPPSYAWDWHRDESADPHLEMFLHPYCHYQLRLIASTSDSLGQFVRFYAPLTPAYLAAVLLMVIGEVLMAKGKGHALTASPPEAFVSFAGPHYLIGSVILLKFVFGFGPIRRLLAMTLKLPVNDYYGLEQEGVYFTLLPVILCACACAAMYLQTTAVFYFLSGLSYIARPFSWIAPSSLVSRGKMLQAIISLLATILAVSLCGTIGLLISSGLLILKVLSLLYMTGRRLDSRETHTSLALLFPVMLLVNLQTLLSMGPLVSWFKAGISSQAMLSALNPDPSRMPGLLTAVSIGLLLYFETGLSSISGMTASGWVIRVLAVASVLYTSESLYRLPLLISMVVLVVSAVQTASALTHDVSTDRENKKQ